MKYPVQLDGFEGQNIELDPPNFLRGAKLLVDGVPVQKKRGRFLLRRKDGQEVTVRLKPSLFYDAPRLEVDGKVIQVIEPLAWYQYLLSSVPVVLIIGGILGALIGLGLIIANIRIFRSTSLSPVAQYALVSVLSIGIPLAYIAFSVMVGLLASGP